MGTVENMGMQVLIDSAFEALKEIFKPNMSLDDVAEKYSPHIDDIIIKYEKEDLKFSAGKFKIACLDKDSFVLSFELYFQDKNKKWSKVAKSSAPMGKKCGCRRRLGSSCRMSKKKFLMWTRQRLSIRFSTENNFSYREEGKLCLYHF